MDVTAVTLEPVVHTTGRLPVRRGLSVGMLADIVVQALVGLYHHWFRAALSMLGIAWGIVSVVVLLAYGDGFRTALEAGFAGAFGDGVELVGEEAIGIVRQDAFRARPAHEHGHQLDVLQAGCLDMLADGAIADQAELHAPTFTRAPS